MNLLITDLMAFFKLTSYALPNKVLALAVGFMFLLSSEVYGSAQQQNRDTILVLKQRKSRRHHIKLYPDAKHQVLFFEVNGVYGKAYQLYIFDVEGKLVTQANIKNKQSTVLEHIEKGDYLFEVFSNDDRIEAGQVQVR